MSDLSWRFQLMLLLGAVALLLTACFRDTSEAIQNQPVAREYPSPTAVQEEEPLAVLPTVTVEAVATEPIATEQVVTEPIATEQVATEPVADQYALTATALIALQTQPVAGEGSSAGNDAIPAGLATAIPQPRATIPPGQDCVHEIRAGDTLFQLSLAYGVTVDAIAAASGIDDPDRIAVGQPITIPLCGTTGFIPPPTSLPTATLDIVPIPVTSEPAELEIASIDDTRSALVEQAQASLLDNAQSDPSAAFSAQLSGAATPSQIYIVQQNDTLFEIAATFGTTVEVLAALNEIDNVDNLIAGQVLQLP